MREKINVLFVHSQNFFGADSTIHAHLMRHLDRERFEVHVACPEGDGPDMAPSLAKVREIPDIHLRPTRFAPGFHHRSLKAILQQYPSAKASPWDFVRLRDYVKRKRVRIIHGSDRPRDAVYALSLARLTGARAVVHVHVAWSHGYSAPAKWGVRNADAVFSISRFVTDTIVATGTPRARVYTILNCVDPSAWGPHIDGSGVRRELAIPANAPVLASVSRLFGQKGHRELLRAFARVRTEVPDAWLLIVGADAPEVHGGSFTQELKVLARDLGAAERVVFTGNRSDIPQIMAACDVFTLPSFEEPFGLVFLEAMATQRPVVALNNGGTPEVVEHGRSGLLAPPGDVAALAANIIALLKDRSLRDRMGAYGRSRVLEYFNAQRMAREAGEGYQAILSKP